MQRKQYLYSNAPVPKSTKYRRLREERALAAASRSQQSTSSHNTPAVRYNTGRTDLFSRNGPGNSFENSANSTPLENSSETLPPNEIENHTPINHSGSPYRNPHEDDVYTVEDSVPVQVPECNINNSTVDREDDAETFGDDEDLTNEDLPEGHYNYQWLHSLSKPLNESTPTTQGDALLACLTLGFRFSLPWVAIVAILKMINVLFAREVIKATKYHLLKYCSFGREEPVFHVYCPRCERHLGQRDSVVPQNMECVCGHKITDINKAKNFFLGLNLANQLKTLLNDPVFAKGLDYRFERQKSNPYALEDIFDGALYREHFKPGGLLYERHNMSYTFNTDGCPIGKSSRQTCWPIYVQINELPPHLRSKYILLAGIYVGRKEPNMKMFLLPFVEEANVLSTEGINWSNNGVKVNSKIIPLSACLDSVARCKVVNMTQFNGRYGCTLCLEKPKRTQRGLRFTVPFRNIDERTHESVLWHAKKAYENKVEQRREEYVVKGVKGPSPVHRMLYLDLIKGIRPDPMHSIFLGVSRTHTDLLLKPNARLDSSAIFMGVDRRIDAISSRLQKIRPPSLITRPPRSLKDVALWKASEWRSWLLFYGVVCLKGLFVDNFVIHFSMLATAAHILLQNSISPENLDTAYFLISKYVEEFQSYFGEENMVYNIHLLLHTKKSIQYLGPLWTHQAFGFEGENRHLLQLKKSAATVAQEIATKYLTFKALPNLCEQYASSESAVEFCETLCGRSLKRFVRCGDVVFVGKGRLFTLNADEVEVLCLTSHGYSDIGEVKSFDRMLYKGYRYTTDTYSGDFKYDDSFVNVRNHGRGRIRKILELKGMNDVVTAVLILQMLVLDEKPLFSDEFGCHSPIKQLSRYGDLIAIEPEQIMCQCVAMFIDNGNFICDVPFGCKGD